MDRTIFITGASRGIGRGTALYLAKKGWNVAFTWQSREAEAMETQAEIRALGVKCECRQMNVTDLESIPALYKDVLDTMGPIHAVLCNAARDRRISILNITPDDLRDASACLYEGQMMVAAEAAKAMVRGGIAGSIVFTSSIHGQMPSTTDFLYGGMKAALERSVKSLALELSPYRIRVNCVAPGAINVRGTDDTTLKYPYAGMVPLGRRGEPEDIASAVGFLVSDEAGYITGQTITVDGGFALPGLPEGWAQAYPVHTDFVQKAYQKMMNEEDENHV